MIQRRSRTRRRLIVLGSVGGSIADLARGLWRSNSGKRWLLPLAVFLCLGNITTGQDRRSPGPDHRQLLRASSRDRLACPSAAATAADWSCHQCGRRFDARTASQISACRAATAPRPSAASTAARRFGLRTARHLAGAAGTAERNGFARLLSGRSRAMRESSRRVRNGQMCLYLAHADRVLIGADLTRASLLVGAEAARRFGVNRVQFVETDLLRPGVRAGAFDVVCRQACSMPDRAPRSPGWPRSSARVERSCWPLRAVACRCASGASSRGSRDSR